MIMKKIIKECSLSFVVKQFLISSLRDIQDTWTIHMILTNEFQVIRDSRNGSQENLKDCSLQCIIEMSRQVAKEEHISYKKEVHGSVNFQLLEELLPSFPKRWEGGSEGVDGLKITFSFDRGLKLLLSLHAWSSVGIVQDFVG
ncbi:unnamed protein product [Camellia sinensis]